MKQFLRKIDWSALLIATAPILTLILEILNRRSLMGALQFTAQHTGMFLFNSLLVFCTLFICLLFRRRVFMFALMVMLWLIAGITNCVMVSMRTLPFTVIDLTLLKDALSLFDVYFNLPQRILIVALGVTAIAAVVFLFLRAPKSERPSFQRIISGCVLLMTLTVGCFNLGLNTHSIQTSLTDLTAAYRQYGFAYCFLTTFADVGVEKPENYSEQAIEEVRETTGHVATGMPPSWRIRPNIVFVQLESFFDPHQIIGLDLSVDPIPTFTRLKNDYPSGYLTMPSIGGGTANSEFEVLTGMTLSHFGAGEYPYNTVLKENAVESICYNLDALNYTSHAIHNHAGSFYSRHLVYPNMGFDTFTSLEYMRDYEINSLGWATDDVLTGEIMRAIQSTDGNDFVFCVSVQSHGHYPTEQVLEETVIEEFQPQTASYWGVDYYVQELTKVDAFIADLVHTLEESDEPTVVVFYGDHLPSLGLESEDLASGSLYQTEYIVWNNYSGLLQHIADRDLYAYQLGAYVLDLLDIHEGDFSRLHQKYLSGSLPEGVDYMNSLQLLEYDMLYGDMELFDGKPPYRPSVMRMGIAPIGITELSESDDALIVKGTGFTDSSEVFFGDKQIPTIYVSPTLLVAVGLPEAGDAVSVSQIASDHVILSTTKSRTY